MSMGTLIQQHGTYLLVSPAVPVLSPAALPDASVNEGPCTTIRQFGSDSSGLMAPRARTMFGLYLQATVSPCTHLGRYSREGSIEQVDNLLGQGDAIGIQAQLKF